ncbi:cysteine dioxygenase [Fulvimonas soli]|uniref:cysteine dioxygenase n=1 Tax=Fulvimonas soli TaxID=155197 RepID=UPI001FEAB422|nr:cysteine dioxygenase family protein [Fulvimonas soli]
MRALREVVLAHGAGDPPDLATLARELGAVIHRHSGELADELDALRRTSRFERWQLGGRLKHGASLLVMVWPPNYATPVHDHAGLWGLEVALHGALEVENWRRDADGALHQRSREWLGPGDATWFDDAEAGLHRCRNLSRHDVALSLHVYGGDLDEYLAYEQLRPGEAWRTLPQRAAIVGQLRT